MIGFGYGAQLGGQFFPYSFADGTLPSAADSFQLWCDGTQHTGLFYYSQIYASDYDVYGYLSVSADGVTIGETCTFKLITGGNTYTTSFNVDINSETVSFDSTTPNFTLPPNSCSDVIACNYGFQQECDYSLISDGTLDCNYNVLTITHFISIIMNDLIPTYQESLSLDLNQDGVLNVVDIVLIVDYILD